MVEITVREIEDNEEWEGFLKSHPEANFLQSFFWGEFHQALGHKIHRTGFFSEGKLLGVMLSVLEDAKRGRYLTVPGGPIIDWQNSELVQSFISEIKNLAQIDQAVFIRVRPQLELDEFSKGIFSKNGFIDAPIHLHAELTSQLDIKKSDDELLLNMRKGTRYEVKKAIKEGIKVTTSTNPKLIEEFYKIQLETAKRQNFIPFSYEFLFEQFKVFARENLALLFRAHHKGKLLASAFIIFYGTEAVYHYGASTDEGRVYPGAYLIQWEAIKEAKKRGLLKYNFWGVAPIDQKDHRFSGLSLFKRGFGGEDFHYLNAQDLVINKPKYLINAAIEKVRKRLRGL